MDLADQSHAVSSPLPMSGQTHEPVGRHNQVGTVVLYGVPIVSLVIDGSERLCLAQISNTLLKDFSYNEIHNRRVALGITCVQCTPVQLEILRRAGAMPISSRRCGMISKREAERLCKSFLGDNSPPKLPDNFAFEVFHECAWGCRGSFVPSRYNSSRAKCIKCIYCSLFFSPNKFVFHSHRIGDCKYVQPDAANFNSWRRHIRLYGEPSDDVVHAWEDVKAMFNGGTRKRLMHHNATRESHESHMTKHPRLTQTIASSSFSPSPVKCLPGSEVGAAGGYASYFGTGIPPISQPYQLPVTQKALEMRQSFVDYLWGSRAGISSLGLPYPLPWPKRPLPSFSHVSPLSLVDGSVEESGSPERVTSEKSDLTLKHAVPSAFTPVGRASPSASPRLPTAASKVWKSKDERKEDLLVDEVTVLPDSSKLSDDESLDVETNEEISKGLRETPPQETRRDEESYRRGSAIGYSISSIATSDFRSSNTSPSLISPSRTPSSAHKCENVSSSISSSISPSSSCLPSPLDSPFGLLPEDDPRLRLFLLREMEARRRMEVEMARFKYTYSSHFQPPALHSSMFHPSALPPAAALVSATHIPIGSKEWLESATGAGLQ